LKPSKKKDKFLALKIHVSIILNKSLPKDFYAMFLMFIEFTTIIASVLGRLFFAAQQRIAIT
jgi:hypothetical protein